MGSQNQLNGGHQATCCVSAQRLQTIMSKYLLGPASNQEDKKWGPQCVARVSRVCRACVARDDRKGNVLELHWRCFVGAI